MSIKLQLPKLTDMKPRLVVVGVGGAGGNAVNNMIATGLEGVTFIAANTDAQALVGSSAEHRVQLGVHVTEGLGAGSRPEVGEAAAEEAVEEIRAQVAGSHMVFVAAGMGGGTGSGAAAVVARVAREEKALVVGIVTKPFQFEGARRMRVAEAGIAELKKHVDTLIVIPNQNLFRVANERTTFAEAFLLADQVLYSGIACIVDVIVREGLINLDFADVRTVLSGMGSAMMGVGEAEGERRALEAAEEAIANPLLDDVSLSGARGLLISITGGRDLTLYEIDEAASRIRREVDPEANIILGATFDDSLTNKLRVSIVASGMGAPAIGAQTGGAGTGGAIGSGSGSGASRGAAAGPAAGEVQRRAETAAQAPAFAQSPVPVSLAGYGGGLPTADFRANARALQAMPLPPAVAIHPQTAPRSAAYDALAAQGEDRDSQDLHNRLSAAFALQGEEEPVEEENGEASLVFDPRENYAGEPWRAPGDVTIEEGLPQFAEPARLPQRAPARQTQPQAPAASGQFAPAAPQDIRRPVRRMPDLEDFPTVGQRDFRAKAPAGQPQQPGGSAQGAGAAPQQSQPHQPHQPQRDPQRAGERAPTRGPAVHATGERQSEDAKRKPGLFERLTGRGRRGDSHDGAADTQARETAPRLAGGGDSGPQRGAQAGTRTRSHANASDGDRSIDLPDFFSVRRK